MRRRGWGWVAAALLVIALSLGVRAWVLTPFLVPSASMEPTLYPGTVVLVDRLAFANHRIGFGDLVVLRRPPRDPEPGGAYLVKRVIGLPGQVISSRDGAVVIDGHRVREPFLRPGTRTEGIIEQRIPAGEYFVLGDNRSDSIDSRIFGPVPASSIVGRVICAIWPPRAMRWYG